MNKSKNSTANVVLYVVFYIVLMIPTYILPYFGSNSILLAGIAAETDFINIPFWAHLFFSVLLMALTRFHGGIINKKWLIIFPVLAGVFDLVPGVRAIPLVPTIMHLTAIIIGVLPEKQQG